MVLAAGVLSDLATALGTLPFFFFDEVGDRLVVGFWGLAGGIMLSASTFGLILEALSFGNYLEVAAGLLAGVVLIALANRLIEDHEFEPHSIAEADFKKLMIILGVLTVHSFPEGFAIGVSFAEMDLASASMLFGVPVLAVFMTLAISIQNIPEGLAVSIPLKTYGYSRRDMVKASIFSSLPQPVGAVLAYYFVTLAREFLPFGFGFAAGAMIYLVFAEMIGEALERGEDLENPEKVLVSGLVIGFLTMAPLLLL
ncbi:MAG: ZIP family metal transporter [Candidatus Nanohaloarchaea archaeon]